MVNLKTRLLLTTTLGLVTLSACSNNEHAHTTVVTQIPPPPHQLLTEVSRSPSDSSRTQTVDPTADSKKPLLIFNLENGNTFRVGEDVPIVFSVMNAKLKGDGGEFRVRYIVDDDEMKWLDTANPISLRGWIPRQAHNPNGTHRPRWVALQERQREHRDERNRSCEMSDYSALL